jgi:hypothetical protein
VSAATICAGRISRRRRNVGGKSRSPSVNCFSGFSPLTPGARPCTTAMEVDRGHSFEVIRTATTSPCRTANGRRHSGSMCRRSFFKQCKPACSRVENSTCTTATRPPPMPVIVNDVFAREYFHGERPVGQRLTAIHGGRPLPYEIVGVVAATRDGSVRGEMNPFLFTPIGDPAGTIQIRSSVDRRTLAGRVLQRGLLCEEQFVSIPRKRCGLTDLSQRPYRERAGRISRRERRDRGENAGWPCVISACSAIFARDGSIAPRLSTSAGPTRCTAGRR